MKKVMYVFLIALFGLSLSGCSGCSKQSDTSWADGADYEYYYDEEYTDSEQEVGVGNAMNSPVSMEIPAGRSLQDAGKRVYADLLDLEERYNFGGIKLCAEMSADREGKYYSSFSQNTTINFCPPHDLHLHKIVVTDSSSNIICRIINNEVSVSVGTIQNDVYRTSVQQPAFIVNIMVSNNTESDMPVVIPIGQMLEVQAPNVQNIVVCNTYSTKLEPYQSKTFSVRAYCGAEKRQDPTYKSAKLTPFVLTAPSYAYNSQQNLWNFLQTKPATDKQYTITFYAWGKGDNTGNNKPSRFGHAFVNIPEIGTVGFSANKEELKDLAMIYVEGNLFDHTKLVQYAKYKVSIPVNKVSLQKAQEKYWEWKNDSVHYTLGLYDCTSFTMDIADAAEIYYGIRWLIQTPVGFLQELQTYNKF